MPRSRGSARRARPVNVVVCAKQIPDPAAPGELDPNTKTLKREGKLILDDSDAYGVEMGLQLADKAGGGEVTLISMAPNSEVSGLRTALAMGAAKAILVSDPALQASDSLAEAKVADLGLSEDDVGWKGARQEIVEVAPAEERQAGEIVEDEGEAHERIVQFLEQLKVL